LFTTYQLSIEKAHPTTSLHFVLFLAIVCGILRAFLFFEQSQTYITQQNIQSERFCNTAKCT